MTDEELDQIFKALGDPTRRRIIDRLRKRPNQSLFEICASAIADGGPALSRQAITQHVELLQKAGLVRIEWSGRTKLHSLDLEPLHKAVKLWLRHHL